MQILFLSAIFIYIHFDLEHLEYQKVVSKFDSVNKEKEEGFCRENARILFMKLH